MDESSSKSSQVTESLLSQESDQSNQPLSVEQINYAIAQIEKSHKLQRIPLRDVWPFIEWICCCCLGKRKKRFRLALKRSLRTKLELNREKSYNALKDDPFLTLGYGVYSYLDLI